MSRWSRVKEQPESCEKLDRIARRLLRAAGVGDELPTPQADVIECAELVVEGQLDLADFKDTFLKKAGRAFFSGWEKIKGILDIRERTIYIKDDIHESQKPFVIFHEVGHNVIPWQSDMYDYFGDNWKTLSPDVREIFEKEANHLSAMLLFQCDRLQREARDYELSLNTGRKFAQDYGASYHSTFWHYVKTHSSTCVLLVLKEAQYYVVGEDEDEREKPYRLLYVVPSNRFETEFGEVCWRKGFDSTHDFTAVVYDPDGPEIFEGRTTVKNGNGERVSMDFQAWSNTYSIFVLIYKKPRTGFFKKRVILE